jgi:thiol-disulfide isomerase/thioredoxin
MSRFLFLIVTALLALRLHAIPPPMSAKDVALLARSGYSDEEIIAEVQKRHFAVPIDAAMEEAMFNGGASKTLIAKLKAGNFVLSREQQIHLARQAAEQRAAAMQREQSESAMLDRRRAEVAALANSANARDNIRNLLDGKLVRLQASEIVPYSASNLSDVRMYAFYYSAGWCGPCRKVTPALAEWYRKTKAAHPEFELIFVSGDRSDITFAEYMRKNAMPWPAVRYSDVRDPAINQFAGKSIPWLSVVSRAGGALTKNAAGGAYTEPEQIMQAVDTLLADLSKPGAKLKGRGRL